MSTIAKTKFPREAAMEVAGFMMEWLTPSCERVEIAGSLRRGKPQVSDVEILYESKVETRQAPGDMFAMEEVPLAEDSLQLMLDEGILTKRPNKNGGTNWGGRNKLAVHAKSGIPVDLFRVLPGYYWANALVCRTGPSDLNVRICTEARKRGLKWQPYGEGYVYEDGTGGILCPTEESVFEAVGLPFLPPEKRK